MSVITDIYDALTTRVGIALPSHKTLNNPYFPEDDAELSYEKAYGIGFAEGSPGAAQNVGSGADVRSRDFIVSLTRRKFATTRDKTTRISTEKSLMDDHTLLLNAIVENPRLGLSALQEIVYSGDGGIEFLVLDERRNNILIIRTVLTAQFEETVTAASC